MKPVSCSGAEGRSTPECNSLHIMSKGDLSPPRRGRLKSPIRRGFQAAAPLPGPGEPGGSIRSARVKQLGATRSYFGHCRSIVTFLRIWFWVWQTINYSEVYERVDALSSHSFPALLLLSGPGSNGPRAAVFQRDSAASCPENPAQISRDCTQDGHLRHSEGVRCGGAGRKGEKG
jgi:hypothetical protein